MNKINPDLISILSLKIFKSGVSTTGEYMDHPVQPDGIEIKVGQSTAFDFGTKRIRVRLNVELEATNKKKEPVGLTGEYVLEFIIQVENLDDFIIEREDKKQVDVALGSTINGIVYSTARGIIYERTAATAFGGFILPVINPNHLIEKTE
jgi:preprotein translocase subunit SecB